MKVYVIAKVSGLDPGEVLQKYNAAREVIAAAGYIPVIPTDIVPVSSRWEEAMRQCIPAMLACDYVTNIDEVRTTAGGLVEDTISYWVKMPRIEYHELIKMADRL